MRAQNRALCSTSRKNQKKNWSKKNEAKRKPFPPLKRSNTCDRSRENKITPDTGAAGTTTLNRYVAPYKLQQTKCRNCTKLQVPDQARKSTNNNTQGTGDHPPPPPPLPTHQICVSGLAERSPAGANHTNHTAHQGISMESRTRPRCWRYCCCCHLLAAAGRTNPRARGEGCCRDSDS